MYSGLAVSRWIAYGAIAAGSAGAVLALAGLGTPLRGPLVLLFLAGAPAAVAASWLRSLDIFAKVVVACAAAIVLNALVAETLLALGAWSPRMGLVAVLLICAVGGAVGAAARFRAAGGRWPHPSAAGRPAAQVTEREMRE
jgi:hypothetical protein